MNSLGPGGEKLASMQGWQKSKTRNTLGLTARNSQELSNGCGLFFVKITTVQLLRICLKKIPYTLKQIYRQ
jgi:hypothetical protein